MRARALNLAQALATGPAGPATGTPRRLTLLAWLARAGSRSWATGSTTWRRRERSWPCGPCRAPAWACCATTGPAPALAALPPEAAALARDPDRLIVTKANSRSTVHRPSYLDYVAVKRVDAAGTVTGEYRFLGLYTHLAFTESITDIPVARRKLEGVLAYLGLAADSHDGTYVAEVLEFYPREELFMTSVPDLAQVAAGRAASCASGGRRGCSCAATSTAATSRA